MDTIKVTYITGVYIYIHVNPLGLHYVTTAIKHNCSELNSKFFYMKTFFNACMVSYYASPWQVVQ